MYIKKVQCNIYVYIYDEVFFLLKIFAGVNLKENWIKLHIKLQICKVTWSVS